MFVAVLAGAITFAAAHILLAPVYCSGFTAYINNSTQNNSSDSLSNADVQAARNLASTYAEIIASRPNVENAMALSGTRDSYDRVAESISVNRLNNTEIIEISVESTDPEKAYDLAQALEQTSPEYVSGIVVGSSMIIVTHAELPENPSGPYYILYVGNAVLLSVVLAIAILVLLELFDTRVKSADELSDRYGVIVIGTIHDLMASESGQGYFGYQRRK